MNKKQRDKIVQEIMKEVIVKMPFSFQSIINEADKKYKIDKLRKTIK